MIYCTCEAIIQKRPTHLLLSLLFSLLLIGICPLGFTNENSIEPLQVTIKNINLYNSLDKRSIPITIYTKNSSLETVSKSNHPIPLVILSPGYQVRNTKYSFIAKSLAEKSYFVVSIQQQLPTDLPLSRLGTTQEQRKPTWEQGIKNINFTLQEIQTRYPNVAVNNLILIGHSNGGDVSIAFAQKYPNLINKIITLDNLRAPIPRTQLYKIMSFRAKDTHANIGVIPNIKEQQKYGVKIIELGDAKHTDLCDYGSESTKQQVNNLINEFLLK